MRKKIITDKPAEKKSTEKKSVKPAVDANQFMKQLDTIKVTDSFVKEMTEEPTVMSLIDAVTEVKVVTEPLPVKSECACTGGCPKTLKQNSSNDFDLKEINGLISVRQYVVNSIDNYALDKKTVSEMYETLLLLDKKIISIIREQTFKDYIKQ